MKRPESESDWETASKKQKEQRVSKIFLVSKRQYIEASLSEQNLEQHDFFTL